MNKIIKNFDSAVVKYDTDRPSIFIEYKTNEVEKIYYVRDMVKSCDEMAKYRTLISTLYNSIYSRVPEKYYELILFAELRASEKRIKFQKKYYSKIKSKSYTDDILFYFSKRGKFVNFTIFDYFLSSVDFGTKFIEENRARYPSAFAVYQDFSSKYLQS